MTMPRILSFFFFFNDTATTEIYTLSLHDALPISCGRSLSLRCCLPARLRASRHSTAAKSKSAGSQPTRERESTRLDSSHPVISYAGFFFLKKKHHTRPWHAGLSEVPSRRRVGRSQ